MVPIPMHTMATRMPTKMPIDRIGVSSKLSGLWELPLYEVKATAKVNSIENYSKCLKKALRGSSRNIVSIRFNFNRIILKVKSYSIDVF